MIVSGDLVRLKDHHVRAGMTGVVERCGVSDLVIRLTATGEAITVLRGDVRRIVGRPVTIETTQQRARQGRAA